MSSLGYFRLSFCILGTICCVSRAWYVKMPSNIKGLLDSCLVIPCSFGYSRYPPKNPNRVVWYKYQDSGYPLVCDTWHEGDVIYAFRWETKIVPEYGRCSLQIYPVTWYHNSQKLYPWVDPENVGRSTYRFFDTTVRIQVVDRADKPVIAIYGDRKVGKSVTVHCSVYHTCPVVPPTLRLSNPSQNSHVSHESLPDGTSKTTLVSTLIIERDHQAVECTVRHPGGRTATASEILKADCTMSPLTIQSTSVEFNEGQAGTVTCTVSYTCPKDIPTLTWNYANMPATTATSKTGIAQWKTVSTLTFTASSNDQGKSLTCYARSDGGAKQQGSITLRVKRNLLSRGWSFVTPERITGMRGSCIVIPCRFTYTGSQPSDLRVIWYLLQSNGYPPVFDQRQNVISKFRGKTSVIGSVSGGNCSLKIDSLEMSHDKDRLYPWVDKNPITSYHTQGFSFFDKTSQIIVLNNAEAPQISITGIPRVGEQSTVSCRVRHTCISACPELALNGVSGKDVLTDTQVSDGVWERKLERAWTVEEEDQRVTCTVSYRSGQKATSELKLYVECPFDNIVMTERPGNLSEGVARSVVCAVSYKCKKNTPTIAWNYQDMQNSMQTNEISKNTYSTVSNLTFIGALKDDKKALTCTARFVTGQTSDSAILHIRKYEMSFGEMDLHDDGSFHVLAADVPFRFEALTRSCVVIPCSFRFHGDEPLTRGIWSKKKGGIVYHNGRSHVLDHFRGRTKMIGDLNKGECSLEIDDIKPFDNGPFCFYAEKDKDRYRFNKSCVFIVMKASPETPLMTPVPEEVDAGSVITVSCSVSHTCPSHPPMFSWSVPNITSEVTLSETQRGIWETTSTITFMAAGGDGAKSLGCTAISWRGKQQTSTVELTVRGSLKYQLRSSLPVLLPVLFLVLIFITVAGVIIYKRRKQPVDLSRPPPRPEKRRSLLDRLSRRRHEDRERPPRPEKRRSIWSQLTRSDEDERVGWHNQRRSFWSRFTRREDNFSAGFSNNSTTGNYDIQIYKQRCPSPKEHRRAPRSHM